MTETITNCPLCGNTKIQLFDRITFHSQTVSYCICASCGLVFQSPRMSAEERDAFYEREYRQMYQGSEGPNEKDLAVQRSRAASLAGFFKAQVKKPVKRHLDIGCSAGLLLHAFSRGFGSQPVGIEPGDAYRQYAGQQGLRVYASLEALQATGEEPFSLITLAHVLEHLPDPVGYLADLRQEALEPNGWLLVEVPNLYAHDSFEIAHLFAFSPHTLVQTLAQAGYQVVALAAHGRPRSNLLPLYTTALARPNWTASPAPVQPEGSVRLKRRLGMLRRRVLSRLLPSQAWLPIR